MPRLILIVLSLVLVGRSLSAADHPLPFDNMFLHVGSLLEDGYYDPGRYRPRVMIQRAIRFLELTEPTMEVSWRADRIRINHAGEIEELTVRRPDDMLGAMFTLQQLVNQLRPPRFEATEHRDMEYRMVNGVLSTLDPHCVLLPPRPASLFKENMRGRFFGIGAFLNQDHGVVRIERVMPGFPAELSGVKDGDIVLAVDGENISGLSLGEVVRRIKGPKDTSVVLTMERAEVEEPLDLAIVRGEVSITTMVAHRHGDVGYVRMDEFNRQTARDLDAQLTRMLHVENPIEAFVLDLRYNGGGLLRQAYTISDTFLPPDREIVQTVELGREPKRYYSGPINTLDLPMVVLVSSNSASAAEILSGSLQINGRALIVGQQTFGKGSVQTLANLPDESQLKYTIQEYRLADGVSIQGQGVLPDLELITHQIRKDGRLELVPYAPNREQDNEFALEAHRDMATRRTDFRLGWLSRYWDEEQWRSSRISSKDFRPDQEAALVLELLQEAVSQDGAAARIAEAKRDGNLAAATLSLLRAPVENRAEHEDDAVAEVLAAEREGLVWGRPSSIAPESLTLSYTGPESVRAGEEIELGFVLKNTSDRSGGQFFAVVTADDESPFLEEEVVFGRVSPQGETTGYLSMIVPLRCFAGRERFTLKLFQGDKREVFAELPVEVEIEAVPRPHFSYQWELLHEGEPQGLALDRPATLRLTVTNDGEGASLPALLYVFKDDDPYTQLGKGRLKLPALETDEKTVCEIPLTVTAEPPMGMIEVEPAKRVTLKIRISEDFGPDRDGRYAAGLYHELALPRPAPEAGTPRPWRGSIRKPELAIVARKRDDDACTFTLSLVDDDRSFVSVYHDEDKIDLIGMSGKEGAPAEVRIDLEDGLNRIQFIATDADETSHALTLRLWHEKADASAERSVGTIIP